MWGCRLPQLLFVFVNASNILYIISRINHHKLSDGVDYHFVLVMDRFYLLDLLLRISYFILLKVVSISCSAFLKNYATFVEFSACRISTRACLRLAMVRLFRMFHIYISYFFFREICQSNFFYKLFLYFLYKIERVFRKYSSDELPPFDVFHFFQLIRRGALWNFFPSSFPPWMVQR